MQVYSVARGEGYYLIPLLFDYVIIIISFYDSTIMFESQMIE